jgi:tetratricopeptide (TPR) repeat protein
MLTIAGRALFQFTKNRYSPTARLAFDELVTRYPEEPNAHYAKGAFLMTVEESEAGLAEFRRVLAMQPSHVPAMLQLAFHLMKEGRYEEALPHAESAVQAEPDFFAAHNALGARPETGDRARDRGAQGRRRPQQRADLLPRAGLPEAGWPDDVSGRGESRWTWPCARAREARVAAQPPSLEPVPPPE